MNKKKIILNYDWSRKPATEKQKKTSIELIK